MNSDSSSVKKVIIFLVDGMRPDGLRAADTPFMDEVPSRGAFTYGASSVMPTTTLPCITSLFFSCPPEIHGIKGNDWQNMTNPIPSLFDVVHRQGLTAAAFYNWEPLRDLSRPGSLAASYFWKMFRMTAAKSTVSCPLWDPPGFSRMNGHCRLYICRTPTKSVICMVGCRPPILQQSAMPTAASSRYAVPFRKIRWLSSPATTEGMRKPIIATCKRI